MAGARAGTEQAVPQQVPSTQAVVQAATPATLLTPDQVAQGQFNLGVELMREHKFAGAAQSFERATSATHEFPRGVQ